MKLAHGLFQSLLHPFLDFITQIVQVQIGQCIRYRGFHGVVDDVPDVSDVPDAAPMVVSGTGLWRSTERRLR